MTSRRGVAFVAVGALGFAVQIGTVWSCTVLAGVPHAVATALGVATAIVHKYEWHRRWTWRDRTGRSPGAAPFVRFVVATGALSLVGNVAIVSLLVANLPIGVVAANAGAVTACAFANFVVTDRLVFTPR
ncbi:MAG: GtrA family protein [Acidobacteria bacterium]|nr:GtrA family protein [Acidobacteriota bacterium]